MGIGPVLERRSPTSRRRILDLQQTAFFEENERSHPKGPCPCSSDVDFLSMYPTVNSLMDLWRFVVARKVRVIEHCQDEIKTFLGALTPEKLFRAETWRKLPAFVKVIPSGDLLPSRAKYSAVSNDWQVAVNYLYASDRADSEGLWFSLPDVVASVLNTGRIPQIVDAFKLVPEGTLPGLRPVMLCGEVGVNPITQDLFRTLVEQRKSLNKKKYLSRQDLDRLDKSLKITRQRHELRHPCRNESTRV